MPVHCERDDDGQWRLREPDGSIATTDNGNPRDGGGHDTRTQCEAQAHHINESLDMARQLNTNAEAAGRRWIRAGRVNTTDDWEFDADDGDELLGGEDGDNWTRYAQAHLGVDPEESEETKQRYSFPFAKMTGGDEPTVFRSGLIAIRQRAGQTGDDAIFEAAGRLIEEIDQDGQAGRAASPARRAQPALPRIAERLFNQPHAIRPEKLNAILWALRERVGQGAAVAQPRAEHMGPAQQSLFDYDVMQGVAVVPVHGTLVQRGGMLDAESGLLGYDRLVGTIEAAEADPNVGAILLDMDSGGGELAGALDAADRIAAVAQRLPMAALANEQACSAAYLIASAAGGGSDRLWATQSAVVGSIGVIMAHIDESRANTNAGIEVTELFAGAHKADGSPYHSLGNDEQTRLQRFVDQSYDMLVAKVAELRSALEPTAIREMQSGVFLGRQRLTQGLIDEVHTLTSATKALATQVPRRSGNALESKRRTKMPQSNPTSRAAQGRRPASCQLQAGENLAEMLNGAIQREVDNRAGDDADESERNDIEDQVIQEMADASGDESTQQIEPTTVRNILNAGINCPPLVRLEGFASVLPGVSRDDLVEAAESDGCDYGGSSQGAEAGSKRPAPQASSQTPADPAAVVELCTHAGVPDLAASLIREGATYEQARTRVQSIGLMAERRQAAVSAQLVSQEKAEELYQAAIKAGKNADQLSTDLFNAACQSQSPEAAVQSRISPDAPSPHERTSSGWADAFSKVS